MKPKLIPLLAVTAVMLAGCGSSGSESTPDVWGRPDSSSAQASESKGSGSKSDKSSKSDGKSENVNKSSDIKGRFLKEGFYAYKDEDYSSRLGENVWCEVTVTHSDINVTGLKDSWYAYFRYYVPEGGGDPPAGSARKVVYGGAYENRARIGGTGWEESIGGSISDDSIEIDGDTLVFNFDSWQETDGLKKADINMAGDRWDFDPVRVIRLSCSGSGFVTEDGSEVSFSADKIFIDPTFDSDYLPEKEGGIVGAYTDMIERFDSSWNPEGYQLEYFLIYIDSDDIPELYIRSTGDDDSILYTYRDGEPVCRLDPNDEMVLQGYREKQGQFNLYRSEEYWNGPAWEIVDDEGTRWIKTESWEGETYFTIDGSRISQEALDSWVTNGITFIDDLTPITDIEVLKDQLRS